MSHRRSFLLAAVIALAFGLLSLSIGAPASAQNMALTEAQTRPDFGLLLHPPARPLRPHHAYVRPCDPQIGECSDRSRDCGQDLKCLGAYDDCRRHHACGFQDVALVNCDDKGVGSHAVQRALWTLRPGGTLVLRAALKACVESIHIYRDVTIVGERPIDIQSARDLLRSSEARTAEFDERMRELEASRPATLRAVDGGPAIVVEPGVKLTMRDSVIQSGSKIAGETSDFSLLEAADAQIDLVRTEWRYRGERSALDLEGGRLSINTASIEAETVNAAVTAVDAQVTINQTTIARAGSAFDLSPSAAHASALHDVVAFARTSNAAFGPRAVGLYLRGSRSVGALELRHVELNNYADGVVVEGGHRLDASALSIVGARNGLTLYGGDLHMIDSDIDAAERGVLALGGQADLDSIYVSSVAQQGLYYGGANVTAARVVIIATGADFCRPEFFSKRGWFGENGYFVAKGFKDEWLCRYDDPNAPPPPTSGNVHHSHMSPQQGDGGPATSDTVRNRSEWGVEVKFFSRSYLDKKFPLRFHSAYAIEDGFSPSRPYYDRNGQKTW